MPVVCRRSAWLGRAKCIVCAFVAWLVARFFVGGVGVGCLDGDGRWLLLGCLLEVVVCDSDESTCASERRQRVNCVRACVLAFAAARGSDFRSVTEIIAHTENVEHKRNSRSLVYKLFAEKQDSGRRCWWQPVNELACSSTCSYTSCL